MGMYSCNGGGVEALELTVSGLGVEGLGHLVRQGPSSEP